MRQCVVLAGGLGTRMTQEGHYLPKVLTMVHGKQLLEHIFDELEREDFTEVLLCLGHESSLVIDALSTIKTKIKVKYFVEEERLGTLGALIQARGLLSDTFTLIMGDCFIINSNLGSIHFQFERMELEALLLCKYTNHPADSDLVEISETGDIITISSPPHSDRKLEIGLAGVYFMNKSLIPLERVSYSQDLTRHLFVDQLANGKRIKAVFHQGIIRDIGTPSRLDAFVKFYESASFKYLVEERFLLLDRDGTLNESSGHISKHSAIFPSESGQKIAMTIKQRSLNFVVLTNQPVIARGEATESKVRSITSKLLKDLELDLEQNRIYICPHYPESGFVGEIVELKVVCQCRKPNPGLLIQAANEIAFRLTHAIMIGDSVTDIQAAIKVGAFAIHLHLNCSPGGVVMQCFDSPRVMCVLGSEVDVTLENELGSLV